MKITVTKAAAKQIVTASQRADVQGMALRIAAKRKQDGSIDYAMGFDRELTDDIRIETEGVSVVVALSSRELLDGMTVDYVPIETDRYEFIFLNPNDPHFIPPKS